MVEVVFEQRTGVSGVSACVGGFQPVSSVPYNASAMQGERG